MPIKPLPLPSQDELRRLFDYDPTTGVLRWRVTLSSRAVAGSRIGNPERNGYVQVRIHGILYLAHRVVWKLMTGIEPIEVDHDNRKRNDMRWTNLREAAGRQRNLANQGARLKNRLGVKGVHMTPAGRFRAQCVIDGKTKHLGVFGTVEEANAAYIRCMRVHYGDFASAT